MRKRVVGMVTAGTEAGGADGTWLPLEELADVEVSSEDDLFPVEQALSPGRAVGAGTRGWRASVTGPQVIRLLFAEGVVIRRILVHVVERAAERSQEFAIYAGADRASLREVVRQQFTFSPGGSTEEREEYAVELEGVRVLELRIDPDRVNETSASVNYASLTELRLG